MLFKEGKKHTVLKLSHNTGNSKPIHNSNYTQLYNNSSHKHVTRSSTTIQGKSQKIKKYCEHNFPAGGSV